MRVLKSLAVVLAFVSFAQYFPVFYYTSMFNDYVKQEPQRTRVGWQLQQALLQKAESYYLPVKSDNIQIKDDGELIRVSVDYRVPVNFFIFKHELSFHVTGAGLAASQ